MKVNGSGFSDISVRSLCNLMEVILLSEKNLILKPIYVNYHVSSELGSRVYKQGRHCSDPEMPVWNGVVIVKQT